MKNLKKYFLIAITLFFAFSLFGSINALGDNPRKIGDFNVVKTENNNLGIASDATDPNPEGSSVDNETLPYTYEEWRNFIIDYYNMTLEDLDGLDNQSIYNLNTNARIYSGWANGTYTDEERDQLLDELHSTPAIEDVIVIAPNDEELYAEFKVYNALFSGEHVFRVYVFIDYDISDTNTNGGNRFHDGDTVKPPIGSYGPYGVLDPYPYKTLPYDSDLNPAVSFMGWDVVGFGLDAQQEIPRQRYVGTYAHGRTPRPIYFIIQVLYRYDTLTGPFNLFFTCKFKWITLIVSAHLDDDAAPPLWNIFTPIETYIWEDGTQIINPSFIYDDEDYLIIGAQYFELSGFHDVTVKIDGTQISKFAVIDGISYPKYGWTVLNVWDGFYKVYVYLFFPGYYYGLGTHTASITVIDNDNDRPNDRLASLPIFKNFEIQDDDESGPTIEKFMHTAEIYDNEDFFTVKVKATDASGIANIMTYIYDIDSFEGINYATYIEDGYYCVDIPNPKIPGDYAKGIMVWDADSDRPNDWSGTFHSLSFTVIDDDDTPPVVNPLNDWEIYDSEENLTIILYISDSSGISRVYATFNGEDIEYDHIDADGNYVIQIPNPRTPDIYSVEVWVWDNDNDRPEDREAYTNTFDFNVVDDDDTPPVVNPLNDWEIYDSEDNLEIIVEASDPSGIYRVYATFDSEDYEHAFIDADGNYHILVPNPRTPDLYTVDIWVWDNDNDKTDDRKAFTQTFEFTVIDDDTTPPEFELISTMEWSGTDILFRFMIDASDESGIGFIAIGFAETPFMGSGWHELILPSGFYMMYVNVTDADNDRPHDCEYHFEIYTIILDLTPPITEISYDIGYFDGETIFVVSETEFSLSATDDVSGVAFTDYSINGGPWITYTVPFSLEGVEGPYVIEFFSEDNVGNVEPVNILNVQLVSLDVNTYISRGQSEAIKDFDVIFRKSKQDSIDGFMLVATNPGQIFYNIEIINEWPVALNILIVDATLPADFVTKGDTPFHVFLDGFEITNLCMIEGNIITISDVAPGSVVRIIVHVDYGLKGTFYETIDEFWMEHYTFFTEVQANSDSLTGTYSSSTDFNAFEKKTTAIAGFVKDIFGNPIPFATVELLLEDGTILTTQTDSEGFYYFLDLPTGIHQIRVFSLTDWQVIETWKDEIFWKDFVIP